MLGHHAIAEYPIADIELDAVVPVWCFIVSCARIIIGGGIR